MSYYAVLASTRTRTSTTGTIVSFDTTYTHCTILYVVLRALDCMQGTETRTGPEMVISVVFLLNLSVFKKIEIFMRTRATVHFCDTKKIES